MAGFYRDLAQQVVTQAADENVLPAVRVPLSDAALLEAEIRAVLEERGLTGEYDVDVRGELIAVVPRADDQS